MRFYIAMALTFNLFTMTIDCLLRSQFLIRKVKVSVTQNFMGGFGKLMNEEKDPGEVKGTKLRILKYPNPLLRAENEEIVTFDANLKQTAEEMILLMFASDGIGLAAPQVGLNKRLMVFNGQAKADDKNMILVNPKIIGSSEETDSKEEGCLSFPQIYGNVIRHKWIEVEYQSVEGSKLSQKFEGLEARVFQHEYDHLQKVLFIDRLVETDKAVNKKRLEKMIKKYGPGGAV